MAAPRALGDIAPGTYPVVDPGPVPYGSSVDAFKVWTVDHHLQRRDLQLQRADDGTKATMTHLPNPV